MVSNKQSIPDQIIEAHLLPGTQLLWSGRPKQGFALRGWDLYLIPVTLLVTIFFGVLIVDLIRTGDALLFVILAGLLPTTAYMLAGRFYVDARRRAHTWYALTNARALIIIDDDSLRARSINPKTLREITFSRRADDTGTIELERRKGWNQQRYEMSRGLDLPWWSYEEIRNPAFEMIPDARQVWNLIRKQQASLLAEGREAKEHE